MASILPPINSPTAIRRQKFRQFKDLIARHAIGLGGISVIIAILLIFFYLIYVVLPIFAPGKIKPDQAYKTDATIAQQTLYMALEEQNEIGTRYLNTGEVIFFNAHNGNEISRRASTLPAGVTVTSFAAATPTSGISAFGRSNGTIEVLKTEYSTSFDGDRRNITPVLTAPLGETAIAIDPDKQAISHLAIQRGESDTKVAAVTADGRLLVTDISAEESMLDETVTLKTEQAVIEQAPEKITHLLLDKELQNLYVADAAGEISHYDISDITEPKLVNRTSVVEPGVTITAMRFLAADISLLIGDSQGRISQWFSVRNKNGDRILTKIRHFHEQKAPIIDIAPEYFRKGFAAMDASGNLGIYYTTSKRTILMHKITDQPVKHVVIGPRANFLLAETTTGAVSTWTIHNPHPEISWSSMWEKVWYENYTEPDYIWQSTSGSNDFEPKLSLVPISFGTLKAAFYAMLVAIPLAVCGAIYTAYFMTPRMRALVKPTIEIMEALPTVILGFLAGLWLAPTLETHLPGIFALMIFTPIMVLLAGYAWHKVPEDMRSRVPAGWEAALVLPVVLLTGWAAFGLSQPIETWLFGGDMRSWLDHELGIDFDQRNALVVGIAMGLAVMPIVFSIAEDAIFAVPRHLTTGSLALGATPWQTLVRVVLLTASPGIFSAIMIGFGRAVGETMIVLMATGNTPVMDFSIFQGMRTLSANIAVEMPESEVNSTHYRVLFLAALILFLFTFFFNSIAEIVRQRLRKKYSSL